MTESRDMFLGVERSATGRAWRDRLDADGLRAAGAIAQQAGLSEILSRIVAARGVGPAEAQTYLQRPDVSYATATGEWRQKIGTQKWIGLYNRPFAGWTEFRRLDYPELPLAVNAISGFPNRMLYPGNEQQLNAENYAAASAAIGGDNVETKLFWDIN